MKKILLLFLLGVFMPITAGAQTLDGAFDISDLEYDDEITWDDGAHTGAYYFTVSLSGSTTYTAYNMDVFLPTGMHVVYGTAEDEDEPGYFVYLNHESGMYPKSSGAYTHTITSTVHNSYQLRLACSSSKNSNLRKTTGKLFTVYVTLDNTVFTSSFSPKPIVKLSGMNLTTSDATKYVPADFACRPFTTGIPTERTLPVNVSAANKVGTLILPFDAELPSGLKAYSCNASEGDLLTLTPAESIEACTPYIVYAENGYSGNLSGTAELPDASNVTDVFTNGLLTGLLTSGVVSTGYILQNKGEGPIFYDAEGVNFSLPAGRCYLTSSGSSVKAFQFTFDDDATGISNVRSKMEDVREKIFDLVGRQVSSPQHGIYIQGMRKVIVK